MLLRFTDIALNQIYLTKTYYRNISDNLHENFAQEIDRIFELISTIPRVSPLYYKNHRRKLVKKYNCAIFYIIDVNNITVTGFTSTLINPKTIKSGL